MKKKYTIILATLLLLYPIYKGARELFWVTHSSYSIGNIHINIRVDSDIVGFQDFDHDKTITVTNSHTKASLKVSYVSIEPGLYFFMDTTNGAKTISIVDRYLGQNKYNGSTLALLSKPDCLTSPGGCGGFNDSGLAALGKPWLTYENGSFHQ